MSPAWLAGTWRFLACRLGVRFWGQVPARDGRDWKASAMTKARELLIVPSQLFGHKPKRDNAWRKNFSRFVTPKDLGIKGPAASKRCGGE